MLILRSDPKPEGKGNADRATGPVLKQTLEIGEDTRPLARQKGGCKKPPKSKIAEAVRLQRFLV